MDVARGEAACGARLADGVPFAVFCLVKHAILELGCREYVAAGVATHVRLLRSAVAT